MRAADRTGDDRTDDVRRETGRAARLAAGAAAGGLAALPFLLLLLLVARRWGPLAGLDREVADRLNAWALRSPGAVDLLEVLAVVLHPTVFRAMGAVVAVVAWRRGARPLAVWTAVVTAVGGVLVPALKTLVERTRPTFGDPVATEASYSFPSGHAAASVVGVGVLLVVALPLLHGPSRPVALTIGVAVVLIAGLDRVALGVHYVSDVVGGWLLAAAVLVGATVSLGRPGVRATADGRAR